MFVPTWVIPPFHQTQGLLDLAPSGGVARALMRITLRLIEMLGAPTVYPLWADKWLQLAGPTAFNSRLWYLGKIRFSNEVFKAAARALKAALRGINGQAKKVVILDLDDTLWGRHCRRGGMARHQFREDMILVVKRWSIFNVT